MTTKPIDNLLRQWKIHTRFYDSIGSKFQQYDNDSAVYGYSQKFFPDGAQYKKR